MAEYVEDAETLALVVELGVDYAQGYHIGRPVPLAELLTGIVELQVDAGVYSTAARSGSAQA